MIPKTHLSAIERRDAERRLQRDIDEYLALQGKATSSTVSDALPNHARDTRYSEPWKGYDKVRAVGVAPGTEQESDGTPTVLVHNPDGTTEIRDVSSFRRGTRNHKTRTVVAETTRQPETANAAKYGTHILTGE